MKRIIGVLSLILLFSISIGAQNYVPFPTDNAQWNVHCKPSSYDIDLPPAYVKSYIMTGDTILDAKVYKKIYLKSEVNNQLKYLGGLREENKRIYYNSEFSFAGYRMNAKPLSNELKNCIKQQVQITTNEVLLYDFNKSAVGDTLYSAYYKGKILAVDSVLIQNTYRKRYTVPTSYLTLGYYDVDYVIEGIGSVRSGLFGTLTPLAACAEPSRYEFISFQQDNQVVYKNPAYRETNTFARWDERDYLKKGTQWYYGERIYDQFVLNKFEDDYYSLKSIKDTIILGKSCHSLAHYRSFPDCLGYESTVFTYQSNDTVYFYNYTTNNFSTLYVYGAQKGDSWNVNYQNSTVRVLVDSVSEVSILGSQVKKFYVTYRNIELSGGGPTSIIIEGIGDPFYFFNSNSQSNTLLICDEFNSVYTGLRCYDHPDYGTYHVPGALDCAYVTDVAELNQSSLKVKLNSSGVLTVEGIQTTEPSTFELLDLKGSVMLKTTVNASLNTVNLSQYDKGLYLYRISANGVLLKAGKIVKN